MRFQTVLRSGLVGIWLILSLAGAAFSQGASVSLGVAEHDSSTPVEITSESLALDQESGTAVFTGDVIVVQGEITLTCQKMEVEYAENPETGKSEIQVIRMYGGVTFVSKQEAAEAEWAVYTLSDEIIVMHENVLVTQGSTALSADKLTYNLDTGNGVMEGRVKTVLQQANN